jgi:hypothetical protein|tara:strand:+ start:2779 stop:3297 length:519 start_codon:yes stop_codon:yes gene_type:complete
MSFAFAEAGAETYLDRGAFLRHAFHGQAPAAEILWLSPQDRHQATVILGHPYAGLRVRYWLRNGRSAWILDEIGKDKPITIGLVIEANHIVDLRILAFRESRGGEVRYPFFTDQFRGLGLQSDQRLDGMVDGITGATLSVRAVKRIANFALYLERRHIEGTLVNAAAPSTTR